MTLYFCLKYNINILINQLHFMVKMPPRPLSIPQTNMDKIEKGLKTLEIEAKQQEQIYQEEAKKLSIFKNKNKLKELKQNVADATELFQTAQDAFVSLKDFTSNSKIADKYLVEQKAYELQGAISSKNIKKLKTLNEALTRNTQKFLQSEKAQPTQEKAPKPIVKQTKNNDAVSKISNSIKNRLQDVKYDARAVYTKAKENVKPKIEKLTKPKEKEVKMSSEDLALFGVHEVLTPNNPLKNKISNALKKAAQTLGASISKLSSYNTLKDTEPKEAKRSNNRVSPKRSSSKDLIDFDF